MEHMIVLAPTPRGRGIGRTLLAAIEDHARTAGAPVMVAAISGENMAAIGFHRALGHVETGCMPELGRKFGRWLDLVLMQKRL